MLKRWEEEKGTDGIPSLSSHVVLKTRTHKKKKKFYHTVHNRDDTAQSQRHSKCR